MDNIRRKDVRMFEVDGDTWVRAGTGGISTNEFPGPLQGCWWRLDRGYDYGELLFVWNDHLRHWLWEPASDMPLAEFQDVLRATEARFVRVK